MLRKFPVMALVTILAMGLAGLAVFMTNRAASPQQPTGKAFPDLAAHIDDAARIEIATPAGAYTLAKNDGTWVLPDKAEYPADAQQVGAFLATLGDMDLLEKKTADPARYDQLTLAEPKSANGGGKTVKILTASGQTLADAIFGKSAPSLGRLGGGIYLRRAGEAQTWLADGLPMIPDTAQHWAERDLFGVTDASVIKSAAIADANGKSLITVSRNKPEDKDFTVKQTLPGKADTGKIDQLGETPVGLDFEDVQAKAAGARPTRTITFMRFDGGTYTLTLYQIGKDVWASAGETGANAAAFAAIHDKYVFKLPAYRLPLLQGNLGEFVIHNDPDPTGATHPARHS
jgi:hypothetical protein